MTPSVSADRIKEFALSLGFVRVGVAAAGRPWGGDRFEEWLAAGEHGGMGWLAERAAERLDPGRLVPGARSVVVVAADCLAGGAGGDDRLPAGAGRVARYARGRDYHNVIGKRLIKLRRFINQELPGVRAYKATDTGAVLERSWAVASGVASVGKSANVLTEEHGSWLLLGSLILDRELPPDTPAPDLCGECVACIEACPTGAIVAPGRVDARRCVSYLTIEHDGPVPMALRPGLGEWLVGCDDCQTACPLSPEDRPAGDAALAPLPGRAAPDCMELLSQTDEEFHARFHGSAIRRVGGAGMRRNAAYRLGVARGVGGSGGGPGGEAAATPALVCALGGDPSEVVRGAVAWALGRIGGAVARRALDARRSAEPAQSVQREIEAALEG